MQLETERLRILPLPQLKLRLEGMPRFKHEAMASPAELAEKIPSSCPWAANWQIIWKERNCSVGSAGFMNVPDETGEVEIRCGITPAFQRRGFMTEALRAIAAWALEQPGVTGVIAETEPENTASRRVLARCGFKPVSATRWRRLGPAEITYRELPAGEIETGLFASFNRYQEVKRCRRRENGRNVLKEIAFTEQWSAEDYRLLAEALRGAVAAGGAVFGADSRTAEWRYTDSRCGPENCRHTAHECDPNASERARADCDEGKPGGIGRRGSAACIQRA